MQERRLRSRGTNESMRLYPSLPSMMEDNSCSSPSGTRTSMLVGDWTSSSRGEVELLRQKEPWLTSPRGEDIGSCFAEELLLGYGCGKLKLPSNILPSLPSSYPSSGLCWSRVNAAPGDISSAGVADGPESH